MGERGGKDVGKESLVTVASVSRSTEERSSARGRDRCLLITSGCWFSVLKEFLLLRTRTYCDDHLFHRLPHSAGHQSRPAK